MKKISNARLEFKALSCFGPYLASVRIGLVGEKWRKLTPTPIMFYVYILKSKKDKNLYIGSTKDLKKRLVDHNAGRVFLTKLRRPLELIYYEAYKSEKDAFHREKNLKLRANALTGLKRRLLESLH